MPRQAAGVQAKRVEITLQYQGNTKTQGDELFLLLLQAFQKPEDDKSPLAGFVDLWQTDASK